MSQRFYHIILFLFVFSLVSCQNIKNGDYYDKIGDLKLNYSVRGKGPIMIVGHLSSGKIGYQLSLKPLEKYFTMVYYEPRGTGKSEAPKSLQEYNQEFIVEEIEDLRKKLNADKIWIFGHSDQSAVALEYALKYPKQTEGLILSGTSLVGTQEESKNRREISEKERIKNSAWFSQVVKDWDYMNLHNTTTNAKGKDISNAKIKWWCYDEASSKKVIPIVNEISKAGRRKAINGKYKQETPEDREKYLKIQDKFSEIKTPILIINGKFDTNNPPKYAEKLNKKLPNSTLILIDKAGHLPWIENSFQTFSAIDNWLKKTIK